LWGKDFRSTGSRTLQFKEFILFDLRDGQPYTLSQEGRHPGGALDSPQGRNDGGSFAYYDELFIRCRNVHIQ
jgi:hypothetical protein